MPTLTTNFGFNLPLVNNATDADLWGGQLNTNWDDLDADLPWTTSSKTNDFSVATSEFNYTYLIDATSNTVTATLPAVSGVFAGFTVRFKAINVDNTVTIDGNGSETIDGATTVTIDFEDDAIVLVCDGTGWQIVAARDNGVVRTTDVIDVAAAGAFGGALFHAQDQKSSGTDGGTASSGVNTRTLNTELTNEISGASLSSNRITLPAGTYYFEARAPSAVSGSTAGITHQIYLYNFTDSAEISNTRGVPCLNNGDTDQGQTTISLAAGRFTLASSKTIELRHAFSAGISTIGLGFAGSLGTEVYADIRIWKIG